MEYLHQSILRWNICQTGKTADIYIWQTLAWLASCFHNDMRYGEEKRLFCSEKKNVVAFFSIYSVP